MIVVDTNLLVYLLLPTTHTVQDDAVLLKDPDWVAPALIHSEFRNVLLGAVRRKKVEADDARVLLDRATEVITVPDGGVDGQAILSLALESGCSAYDCEFAWLARALRVPLQIGRHWAPSRIAPCLAMYSLSARMKSGSGPTHATLPLDVAVTESPSITLSRLGVLSTPNPPDPLADGSSLYACDDCL